MRKPVLIKEGYAYVHCPDHPQAKQGGYVAYHRLIMEVTLDRYLTPDELVHHIDGNKQNNDPSNLAVVSAKEHLRSHRARLCDKELLYKEYIVNKKPMEQIAKEYETSRQTVAKWISHFNFPLRLNNSRIINQVGELHELGFTQEAISKKLGISQMTVSRRLRKYKLIKRTESGT